jgi:FixJ family two-component response regulator
LRKVPVISIVDDDESVREATTGLVRSFGYVAAPFASAEEFLHSDRVRDTSCLISDLQMSGLSGVELQDRLNAAGHRVPIIFITAFPEERIHSRILKAGTCGFLTKPFSVDSLFACLDMALKRQDRESSEHC